MDLIDIQIFRGPSIYSHKPVIKMDVKLGDLVDTPTKDIKGLNEHIIKLFPGLKDHKCSKGYPGGFLQRLDDGTYPAHVIEHICIEIQRMLGFDIKFGRTRNINDDAYRIVYGCIIPAVGKACGFSVFNIVKDFVEGKDSDFDKEIKKLQEICEKHRYGPSTKAIVDEVKKRGIPVNEVSDSGLIRLGYGRHQKYISATLFENTGSIAVDIACDKSLTKTLLKEVSVPVPDGEVCIFKEDALNIAHRLGYPVVLKPKSGNQGKFVFAHINSDKELVDTFKKIKDYDDEVIVEQRIEGKDFRLLVVGGKMVAAAKRIPAHVLGDGKHTVKQLVDIENSDDKRGDDHEKPLTKIKIDESTGGILEKQELALNSVPDKDRVVWLKENANLSTGGMASDCTDKVHPENREKAELAAKSLGLDIAGIDMLTPDISSPEGTIVEVNAAPGIRMHLMPSKGQARNVGSSVIDMIYPSGTPYTIPIVSVTGTNGKTTTTRIISHILQDYGFNVGMTTTHGIYVNNECIEEGDTTGPKSANRILNNRTVDVAVLETARGGIIRDGLAYKSADVAVFTNLSEDHLGLKGVDTMEDLLYVKSLVIEAVKKNGTCVLNADDEYVMKAKDKAGGNILLFSTNRENPYLLEHEKSGGTVLYTNNQTMFIKKFGEEKEIIKVNDIPAVLNGSLKHNIYNSLAAVGAVYSIGMPTDLIKNSLKSFKNDANNNPGRFNIYDLEDGKKVVLDYGHNLDGYRVTIEGAKKMNPERLIGIIGVPGDRRNKDIMEIAKLAGQSFDKVIVKEDKDLRGRKPFEVANLLKTGVDAEAQNKTQVISDEAEALSTALEESEQGDVIVVFFEKRKPLIEVINEYKVKDKANKQAVVSG